MSGADNAAKTTPAETASSSSGCNPADSSPAADRGAAQPAGATGQHSPGHIVIAREGGIARIVLTNPHRYNAMSLAMWDGLAQAVAELDADPDVRVIALSGAGEKAFVSGADISEFATQRDNPAGVANYERAVNAAQGALLNARKPTVACIRGVCMGGGIGLALSCDLRIANHSARVRMPAARLGLGYTFQGIERAVQVMGAAHAMELFFLAQTLNGERAERMGLVQRAVPDDEYEPTVATWLRDIAGNAPLTIHAAKFATQQALLDPGQRRLEEVALAVRACFESEDYQEGRAAFAQKRTPAFKGR
jgi:enoyl-CoA hydratase/carnithine racemase